MKLNRNELRHIMNFLHRQIDKLPTSLLDKLELAIWISGGAVNWSAVVDSRMAPLVEVEDLMQNSPVLLTGNFGVTVSRSLLEELRDGDLSDKGRHDNNTRFPFLLIRTSSWTIVINCGGDILTEHCDEDADSIREATDKLKERCESLRDLPNFNSMKV